jgi:protein CpxP
MRQSSHQCTHAAARTVAAALLAASVALAPGVVLAAKASNEDRAEARVKDMHARLKITPAQEDQWARITQEMRDNAKSMDALTQARIANANTMTAVEDLKSYEEIAEAHAKGIKEFIVLFEPLYSSMSDSQKKEADELFRKGGRRESKSK